MLVKLKVQALLLYGLVMNVFDETVEITMAVFQLSKHLCAYTHIGTHTQSNIQKTT